MPSPHQMTCCGQNYITCRLRQGRGHQFTAGAPAGTTLLAFDDDFQPAQEQSSAAGPAGSHHQTQPEAGAGGLSADAFTTSDGLLRPAIHYMQAATGARATSSQQVHLLAPDSRHLMAAAGQPRSSPLLLGRQGATAKHNLKQVQAGFKQMPLAASLHDGQPEITTSLVRGLLAISCRWTTEDCTASFITHCLKM